MNNIKTQNINIQDTKNKFVALTDTQEIINCFEYIFKYINLNSENTENKIDRKYLEVTVGKIPRKNAKNILMSDTFLTSKTKNPECLIFDKDNEHCSIHFSDKDNSDFICRIFFNKISDCVVRGFSNDNCHSYFIVFNHKGLKYTINHTVNFEREDVKNTREKEIENFSHNIMDIFNSVNHIRSLNNVATVKTVVSIGKSSDKTNNTFVENLFKVIEEERAICEVIEKDGKPYSFSLGNKAFILRDVLFEKTSNYHIEKHYLEDYDHYEIIFDYNDLRYFINFYVSKDGE